MTKKTYAALAACLALSLIGPSMRADAYDLRPMVIQLRPSGAGAAATAVITNTHEVPIAIEVKAFRREQQSDGTDKLTPEDRDFILTPPQMVIPPKGSQSFRIQWVGEAKPQRELAFRIVTEQLPIQLSKVTRQDRTADITMKYRYEMAVYVQPEGVKPSARIVSAKAVTGKDGTRQIALRIRSEGTMRAILDKPAVSLSSSGGQVRMEGDAVRQLIGLNILPGVEREVFIAAPAGIPAGDLTATLSTSYMMLK